MIEEKSCIGGGGGGQRPVLREGVTISRSARHLHILGWQFPTKKFIPQKTE
jgi:hypothetical protein